jgi:hypothetical protein
MNIFKKNWLLILDFYYYVGIGCKYYITFSYRSCMTIIVPNHIALCLNSGHDVLLFYKIYKQNKRGFCRWNYLNN